MAEHGPRPGDEHGEHGEHEDVELPERRARLIAAAAVDELSAAERDDLEALRATDPSVDEEVAGLRSLLDQVAAARPQIGGWRAPRPDRALGERVLGGRASGGRVPSRSGRVRAVRRTPVLVAAAAVAGLSVGVVIGNGTGPEHGVVAQAPEGPPGTLGATESIAFTGQPAGVRIDAALVAHTWGTETVLEMDGFAEGRAFEVVLLDRRGRVASSGSFQGSRVVIECRLNAAWLRERVEVVEIRDRRGRVVARSDVPTVRPAGA